MENEYLRAAFPRIRLRFRPVVYLCYHFYSVWPRYCWAPQYSISLQCYTCSYCWLRCLLFLVQQSFWKECRKNSLQPNPPNLLCLHPPRHSNNISTHIRSPCRLVLFSPVGQKREKFRLWFNWILSRYKWKLFKRCISFLNVNNLTIIPEYGNLFQPVLNSRRSSHQSLRRKNARNHLCRLRE